MRARVFYKPPPLPLICSSISEGRGGTRYHGGRGINIELLNQTPTNHVHFQNILKCFNLIPVIKDPAGIGKSSSTLLDAICKIPKVCDLKLKIDIVILTLC